jgi:hypothetical protein
MLWGLVNVYLGKEVRLRARDREGSHTECRTGIMSCGIPVDSLPINAEGLEENTYLEEWIQEPTARGKKSLALTTPGVCCSGRWHSNITTI